MASPTVMACLFLTSLSGLPGTSGRHLSSGSPVAADPDFRAGAMGDSGDDFPAAAGTDILLPATSTKSLYPGPHPGLYRSAGWKNLVTATVQYLPQPRQRLAGRHDVCMDSCFAAGENRRRIDGSPYRQA